jgi:lysophospholipase L1-like esterase
VTRSTAEADIIVRYNIDSYKSIIASAERVVVFFVPSREECSGGDVSEYKQVFLDELRRVREDAAIVDLLSSLATHGASIFRDDVHFNREGHRILADLMLPVIVRTMQ